MQDKVISLIDPKSKHYNMFDGVEAIERFEDMFTVEELKAWAKLNVFKYRFRVGNKGDAMRDVEKIKFYENYYKELCKG
jgi:hypothetical protein